ncbi:MAG: cobalamin-dependent protein [Planctomycetes bacterium]|nr:cobalamin-dependent protein [Planctomycetota bacterium]
MALLTLGTLAENKGHIVKVLHQVNGTFPDELTAFKPDIVGITVNTFQVKHARMIAQQAKEYGAKVVIGGPHAPAWNGSAVDKIVVGEGENRWLEILGEKPSIATINDVPRPNYDLIDFDQFTGINPVGAPPAAAIMASRGCPYQCTFCNTPIFWGKKIRYRDPKKVVDEVQHLHEHYGINEIFFQDDTFNVNLTVDDVDGVHASYFHLTMCGERWRTKWRTESTHSAAAVIMGSRGTENGDITTDNYRLSQTLELHGAKNQWVGNLVFQDNHTETVVSFYPNQVIYQRQDSGTPTPDNIFDAEFNDFPLNGDEQASGDTWLTLTGPSGMDQYTATETFYDPLVP